MKSPLWFRSRHPRTNVALAAALLALSVCNFTSCNKPSETVTVAGPASQVPPRTIQVNAGSAKKPTYSAFFNPDRAWRHLEAQVACGFRVPNTPGAAACRKYLVAELTKSCEVVEQQPFTVKRAKNTLRMTNIIGRFDATNPQRILLMAHWDTRPTADLNPPGLRNKPIEGANDGASGVAVLLELARVFKAKRPPVGVDIVLVDGEDYGPQMTMMFLGAKHFAAKLTPAQVASYNYGVLLDMVGDASLDIHPEEHGDAVAGLVYQAASAVSADLGYTGFKTRGGYKIFDDHLPLIERGVRMYDFIDFNYPHWHTTSDTVDKCSPASLECVGRTVENLVYLMPNIYDGKEPLPTRTIPGGWK
jgi:glutaminyl-peptide cyclotransferase